MKRLFYLTYLWRLTRRSFAEMSIGIVVGCLPTLPRFFKQFCQTRSISSDTTKVNRGSGSSWEYWSALFHRFRTAYADGNQVPVFPTRGLDNRSPKSTAPYLPPLNFSNTSIGMFDESLPQKPQPISSKHVSATHSQLWRAPTSWLSDDEGDGSRVQQYSSDSESTLYQADH